MRPPEKPQMVSYFIDRHNYMKTFFHLLEQRNIIQFVADTYSAYGTGKTTVLSTLFHEIEAHYPAFIPLWLSLDQFSVHYQNPKLVEMLISKKEDRKLLIDIQNLIDYHDLLVELGKECLPGVPHLATIIDQSSMKALKRNFGPEYDGLAKNAWKQIMEAVLAGRMDQELLKQAIQDSVSTITQEFLSLYNPSIKQGQHVLLFADDYCWISDEYQSLGGWVLNDLSENMRSTWTIIARTTPDLKLQDHTRELKNLYLTHFTPEETAAYLHERLELKRRNLKALPPMVVENIYRFSKGHPQKVSMIADLLHTSLENHPDDMIKFSDDWKEGKYEDSIPKLLRRIVDDTPQPWLRQALWLGTIARRFDANLLYLALKDEYQKDLEIGFVDEEEIQDEESQKERLAKAREIWCKDRILRAVTRYSFVEQHHDDYGIYYSFQNNMRDAMLLYLKQEPELAGKYDELHQQLANAYSGILSGYAEQEASERYVALYRYEDPTWQRMVTEWLYHISELRDRYEADLEFLTVYFVGFQWWDNFLPFEFCQHILQEWELTQGKEGKSEAFTKVSEFAQIYPREFHKNVKGDPRWIQAQTLLNEIAALFHLFKTDDEDQSDKEQALRAALMEMLTVSYRLSPEPNYKKAEELYRKAIEDAQTPDEEDEFNESYARAYFADMLFDLGRYDEAYDQATQVNDLMEVETPYDSTRDYEVVTQSYRVMGDCCLFQGRFEDVGQLYSRSTMCGYAQNFALQHDADPYTLKWYNENVRLNAQYLIEVAQTHSAYEQVEAICHEIHDTWETYWTSRECPVEKDDVLRLLQQGDKDQLRVYLAPPEPNPNILSAEMLREEFNRIAGMFGVGDDETDDEVLV